MCGIFGRVTPSESNDGDWMNTAGINLRHRGPDARGKWVSPCGRVLLGHNRLSVVDLSSSADQPIIDSENGYAIVFNGEIYNFRDLKKELEAKGCSFATASDTEVILRAYKVWGVDCVHHFNGMFAFAIYDRGNSVRAASIFFARDRVGEKPIYYSSNQHGFFFASELKALRKDTDIDLRALNFYLALGYVPADMCLFQGARKLPPAHCGLLDIERQEFKSWCYWQLPNHRENTDINGAELAQEAARLIEDSVRSRLEADVPVGILLSGGLDSSLVAAAAARVSKRPIETFTMALPGSDLNEAHHAQKVADFLGAHHHVLPLDKPSLSLLDGLATFIDEPIADSSILPAWMVFGLARQHVTVALGGDGGDELFGGYTDYTASLSDKKRWGLVPGGVFRLLAHLAAQLPAGVKGRNRLASLRGGPMQQMIWGRPYFDETLRKRILKRDAWESLSGNKEAPENFLLSLFLSGTTDMDRMTRTHFGSILPDDFLVKVDRASMAHSLEVRAPMLDHRLIEFCFSQVPDDWKVKNGESRRLQRLLAEKWLPPDLDTRRKQGFSIPVNEWLRAESEVRLMERMESLPDVINLDEVRSLVRGHLTGRANGGRLFGLIMLAIAMQNRSS